MEVKIGHMKNTDFDEMYELLTMVNVKDKMNIKKSLTKSHTLSEKDMRNTKYKVSV